MWNSLLPVLEGKAATGAGREPPLLGSGGQPLAQHNRACENPLQVTKVTCLASEQNSSLCLPNKLTFWTAWKLALLRSRLLTEEACTHFTLMEAFENDFKKIGFLLLPSAAFPFLNICVWDTSKHESPWFTNSTPVHCLQLCLDMSSQKIETAINQVLHGDFHLQKVLLGSPWKLGRWRSGGHDKTVIKSLSSSPTAVFSFFFNQ